MLRIGLAPTSVLKCSLDFFRQTAALARQHPGVRLHSHLCEVKVRSSTPSQCCTS